MLKTKRSIRPFIELLEDRLTPAGPVFINLDNGMQFRLVKPMSDSWISNGGIYSTSAEVMIGLQGSDKFQPVLAVEYGVTIDTNAGRQSFTITKPQGKDNYLDYFPNSISKLTRLWEFKDAYVFRGDDLKNLVDRTAGATATVTVAGPAIVPFTDDKGLKINGNLTGSTLVPTRLVITQSQDNLKLPSVLLSGRMTINVGGKLVQKLISNFNVNIGDDATYSVKADAAGLVQLVSKTGSGVWISLTPKDGEGTFTAGPLTIQMTFLQINWDQTAKSLSIAGRFEASLKDDSDDTTPVQFDLGDQANPGLTIDFSKGARITRFQAAIVPGMKGGSSRASFTFAGATVSLDGLFFLYDGVKEQFGIGGSAQLTWGQAGNNVSIVLGNAKQDQPGLFIENGKVKSFNGRITGKFQVAQLPLGVQGNVFATYVADKKTVTISGDLKVTIEGFTAGLILPPPGLIITDGEFSLPGNFGFTLNGNFGIKDFQFQFNNLLINHSRSANNTGGFDDLWTVTGGATLSSFFNVSVNLTGGGLIIRNGKWDIEGIQIHAANLTAGGFGLQDFFLQYDKTPDGKDYEVKVSATLALGLINVGAAFDIKDGHVSSIAADFKAIGEDPGLPVGDTGLFITELGFEVDNLDHLSQWVFQGTVAIAFGEGIAFEGQTVRLFSAEGHFKADSQGFDLDKADFSVMDGYLAKGSGTMNLDWGKHVYHVALDVSGFDGLINLHSEFNLNQFNQITALADIGLQVPNGVPFIGGDRLADLEGLLYIDTVVKENDLVAAWIDINTYIFGHWRIGGEFLFYPKPGQARFQILWGSDVEKLEKEATSHQDGYHTTFTPTIAASDPAPNQSLFTYEWDTTNEVGDVTITVPGVGQPVVITKGSTAPARFTANGKTYVVQPVKELAGERRYAFIIGPDTTVNALAPLPTGQYTVDIVTAEMTTGKLIHAEALAPPEIKSVTVTQPSDSNLITLTLPYVAANPASTTIDLYYTTDPAGGSGTLIKTIPLTDKVRQTGTIKTTWDITDLPWKQKLYIFARASDVAKDLNGNTGKRTGSATVATTSVSAYADLTVQLKLTPAVPVDSLPETLAGWPVLWQQLGTDGKSVIKTVRGVTDSFGQAGISAGKGTNWTVTVAPKTWDGFIPLPGKGQTSDASGQLITARLTGGTYGNPQPVVVNFQTQVSIHGQVSLDLTGSQAKELGGAGLTSQIVYLDQNKNGLLDPGEPRTMSDLKGYYDLRFPLPTTTTNYSIRILPAANTLASFVRNNPDSTTNFSFQTGLSYSVTVNPNAQTLPLFNNRDFLVQEQILISGFTYASGPSGAGFVPGSTPIPGIVVHLEDAQGHRLASTTSAADGSYQFSLPAPGNYVVSTDQQNHAEVNVPGQHVFKLGVVDPHPVLNVTTPGGYPVYQVGYTTKEAYSPVSVSGDFANNGRWEMATLGWSPDESRLYLVQFNGNDASNQPSYQIFPLVNNFDLKRDALPGLSFSHAFGIVVAYFADHLEWYDLKNLPAFPQNVTQIAGFASDAVTKTDGWLLTSPDHSTWSVLTWNAAGPSLYSTFDFSTSLGVRPIPVSGKDYARMTLGDFDGDGVSDVAFGALNASGQTVVAYLLSRERDSSGRFTQVHTLLSGSFESISAIPLGNGKAGANSLSMLAIHSGNTVSGNAELAMYLPQPASGAAQAKGSPATSFQLASTFKLPYFTPGNPALAASTDIVADMNGDGLSDLVVIPVQRGGNTLFSAVVAVFLNDGTGQFSAAPLTEIDTPADALFTAGLISFGNGAPPSVLAIAANSPGTSRLDDALRMASNSSFISSSYSVEINSPGSYGGYNFGFVNPSRKPTAGLTGIAYVDVNQNGKQDPGEPNLAGRRVRVTIRDAAGDVSQQVLTTDATGKYTITTPGTVILQSAGLFPANTQPANAPPAPPINLSPYTRASSAKFVQALYLDELGRTASANEVNSWATVLNGLGGATAVVSGIATSLETRTNLVVSWFKTYLGRAPSQNEIPPFTTALATQTEEAVLKTIVGSDEFYNRAQTIGFGGTPDENYVRELYRTLLGRTASTVEVTSQVNELHKIGKEALSLSFLQSTEYRGNFIRGFYINLLNRYGTQKEIDFWLASTLDKRAMRLYFESAPEYFAVNATTSKVGGTGIVVGGSNLIQTLDYGDTFTLGTGSRPGYQPNQPLGGNELNVEYHSPLAPMRTWSSQWQISDDLQPVSAPRQLYPGTNQAGSSGGFVQAAGATYLGIEYGLRDQYVVQLDAVQTAEPVVISTGLLRDTIYGAGSLTVQFLPGLSGIKLTRQNGVADFVWNTSDGNFNHPVPATKVTSGAKLNTWNNYAVAFDRIKNTLSIYVNQKLLKTLDLTRFANGTYTNFSNAAVTVGAGGAREWLDNFQVGAPYVGYQKELPGVVPAYAVPAGTVIQKDQLFGSLGMDFNVNKPVIVSSLGAFDSGGKGFDGEVFVTLYNRATQEQVAQVIIGNDGEPGTLVGGSRFASITPIRLEAGFQGTIAVAFLHYPGVWNEDAVTWATDDLDGAISFVGHGRYNFIDPLFPTSEGHANAPANAYAAGSFLAQAVDAQNALAGYNLGLKETLVATGAIQGAVVLAPNENSQPFAPGLPPFAGVRVFVDLNGDGHYSAGEPSDVTDVHGAYRISGLRPGHYVVRQDLPLSYVTRPFSNSVDVLGGQTLSAVNFSDVKPKSSIDFNSDGKQDLVRLVPVNSKTTQIQLDIMDGSVVGRVQVVGNFDPRVWQLAGAGDFNNDGQTDLLFEKLASRELWYWQLKNGELLDTQYLAKLPLGMHVAAIGDLDGQGSADLVIQQKSTGLLTAWMLSDNKVTRTTRLGSLGASRVLEGLADMNGDGHVDLIFHDNKTGAVLVQNLNGTTPMETKQIGSITPNAHLITTQPWKQNDATGLDLDWEDAATGTITRWQFHYTQGLLRTITDYHLGDRLRLGYYLANRNRA